MCETTAEKNVRESQEKMNKRKKKTNARREEERKCREKERGDFLFGVCLCDGEWGFFFKKEREREKKESLGSLTVTALTRCGIDPLLYSSPT